MKKFQVMVTASFAFIILADNEEEAHAIAIERAQNWEDPEWDITDTVEAE